MLVAWQKGHEIVLAALVQREKVLTEWLVDYRFFDLVTISACSASSRMELCSLARLVSYNLHQDLHSPLKFQSQRCRDF